MNHLLPLALVALLGAGCATVSLEPLAPDNPANPAAAAAAPEIAQPALMAGSEPLARWLATNQVDDVAHDDHSTHSAHKSPTPDASTPVGKEHRSE